MTVENAPLEAVNIFTHVNSKVNFPAFVSERRPVSCLKLRWLTGM